jgi:hypothetical protein
VITLVAGILVLAVPGCGNREASSGAKVAKSTTTPVMPDKSLEVPSGSRSPEVPADVREVIADLRRTEQEADRRPVAPGLASSKAGNSVGSAGLARNTLPTFSAHVSPDVQKLITEFLTAYHKGDGKAAYECLQTDRDEFRIVQAFEAVQIPLLDPKITMTDKSTVVMHYQIPHPGDIIAAILDGADDAEAVKRNLSSLAGCEHRVQLNDEWTVSEVRGRLRIGYGRMGIIRFADLIGTDVLMYLRHEPSRRSSNDAMEDGGELVRNRVTSMLGNYFIAFKIDIASQEGDRVAKEIIEKVADVVRSQRKLVVHPLFSIKVPRSWKDLSQSMGVGDRDKVESSALVYAGRGVSGSIVAVAAKKEATLGTTGREAQVTDAVILLAAMMADRSKSGGDTADEGDATVSGVPSRYRISISSQSGRRLKKLRYLLVVDRVLYTLNFSCDESAFDAEREEFAQIKDSFKIKENH